MSLWVMILMVSVGAPSLAAIWWAGNLQEKARRRLLDGDQYEAEEMLVAFGATKEWV